jgi:hypothetical protein
MIALTTNLTSLWPWCSWNGRSRNAKKWQALQFQITFCLHDYGPFTFVSFHRIGHLQCSKRMRFELLSIASSVNCLTAGHLDFVVLDVSIQIFLVENIAVA